MSNLCGPICIANSFAPPGRNHIAEIEKVLAFARELGIPEQRALTSTSMEEIGQYLDLAMNKNGEISFRGQPLNPLANSSNMTLTQRTDISNEFLELAGKNGVKTIALIAITPVEGNNRKKMSSGLTRLGYESTDGHYIIIDRTERYGQQQFALVRDPMGSGPFWVALKPFKNKKLGFSTFELFRPNLMIPGTENAPGYYSRDNFLSVIFAVVQAKPISDR